MLKTTIFDFGSNVLHILEQGLQAFLLARKPPLRVLDFSEPTDAGHGCAQEYLKILREAKVANTIFSSVSFIHPSERVFCLGGKYLKVNQIQLASTDYLGIYFEFLEEEDDSIEALLYRLIEMRRLIGYFLRKIDLNHKLCTLYTV